MTEPSYRIEYGTLTHIGRRRPQTRAEFIRDLLKGRPTIVVPSGRTGQRGVDATRTSPKDGYR